MRTKYKNGYVIVTECIRYTYEGKYNWDDPFGNEWRMYNDDYELYMDIPFVVDGNSAYFWFDYYLWL